LVSREKYALINLHPLEACYEGELNDMFLVGDRLDF